VNEEDRWDYNTRSTVDPARKPPNNPFAEAALLGGILIDNRVIDDISGVVTDEDFYDPFHAQVFKACMRLHERGKIANPISLRPIFEHVKGGPDYLIGLTDSSAALIGCRDFAEQVAELSARRRMLEIMREGTDRLFGDGAENPGAIAAALETDIWAATARSTRSVGVSSAGTVDMVKQHLDELASGKKAIGATCKTIEEINTLIGPAVPGRYNIIAGRPGMGKSTLMQSAAMGYAMNGHAVEYYLAEMSGLDQSLRYTSDLSLWLNSGLRYVDLVKGRLTPQGHRALDKIREVAASLPLNFDPVGRCDIRAIRGSVARAVHKWKARGKKLEVVIIDYLQILNASEGGKTISDDKKRIDTISSVCLDIAKEFDVCVYGLSQLGREVDDRKDRRPQLRDLKGSGNLEQDADSVSFVYREEYYLRKERVSEGAKEYEEYRQNLLAAQGKVDLLTRKNRHGPEDEATCRFIGDFFAIRSSAYNPYADQRQDGFDLDV
jgi:replicative DNA helicase